MSRQILSRGNRGAKVMIVSDGPTEEDVKWGKLWTGIQAKVLAELLEEVGIDPKECWYSTVCQEREEGWSGGGQKCFLEHVAWKKAEKVEGEGGHELVDGLWVDRVLRRGRERLRQEIEEVKPCIVVAMGALSLWALTGRHGLEQWRGSLEQCVLVDQEMKVIPTYHPHTLWMRPELSSIVKLDLRRVSREMSRRGFPPLVENFQIEPTFSQTISCLEWMLEKEESGGFKVAYDIETRAGQIACIGLAWSGEDAICIPFMDEENLEGYWGEEEEIEVMCLLYRVMTHRNFEGIAQNGGYDNNFIWEKWGWVPRMKRDTMITQHAMFPTGAMTSGEEGEEKKGDKGSFKKNLGYLSSIYRKDHRYWKNVLEEWTDD